MQQIHTYLGRLSIGKESTFENLSVFALLHASAPASADFDLLADALAAGTARITEVDAGGRVPELRLENAGLRPVFVLDGEELVGAKQNRVANVSLLAPPGAALHIPVSCVEAGRWRYESEAFATSERTHFAKGRAEKLASVSASLRSAGSRHSDQDRVWASVAEKAASMDVRSATTAMSDVYDSVAPALEDFVAGLPAVPGQVGAAFAVNGRLAGLEGFGDRATFDGLYPKIVRSWALDAIEERGAPPPETGPSRREVAVLLAGILSAACEDYAGVGIGRDLRIAGARVIGGALALGDDLVHLACFYDAARRERKVGVTDLRVASARRRWRRARGE